MSKCSTVVERMPKERLVNVDVDRVRLKRRIYFPKI